MRHANDLLIRTLRTPDLVTRFSLEQWDLLVRQARQAGLLARLQDRFSELALLETIPLPVRWHFDAAATLAHKQQIAVRWEVGQIRAALAGLDSPLVVLKGAAYVVAGLPAARGRLFNDIDILVPRGLLNQAEAALMLAGWHATSLSPYDERYYRRWMHEIPPMQHIHRATVIDVHHAILPDTARYPPSSALLRSRALPVHGMPHVQVLAPEDMLLHSAAHLFHDGELPHGLRDLTDLDLLFRHFGQAADFWPKLQARAAELELQRSLFYAVRYARYFLDTPIPADFNRALEATSPSPMMQTLMDAMFRRALAPDHESCADAFTPWARKAAYIRAHWLRMPPHLLFPHLFHKAFIEPRYDPQTT